ncbi:hypothetical protein DFH06DRAFT_510807 [Mycena polygramma]|nr:hypothetical protein DFH06DRAFT_510807 [Mycena polygramma]
MEDNMQTESDFSSGNSTHEGPDSASGVYDSQQTHADLPFSSNAETLGAASYGSTIFSKAHHFTVSGGTFTNVTHNYNTLSIVSDFRTIRLGDIDLRDLRLDTASDLAGHPGESRSTRRVYTARVEGRKSNMTVAIYQGNGAEEVSYVTVLLHANFTRINTQDWREDVALYTSLRHPDFVQLWGLTPTSRSGIHAAVFHDDLISFNDFVNLHRHSPLLVVYIFARCGAEHESSRPYFYSVFEGCGLEHYECTLWIRHSTGRLCVDPHPGQRGTIQSFSHIDDLDLKSKPLALTSLNAPGTESIIIDSLTIPQYHQICRRSLRQSSRWISISSAVTVHMAAAVCWVTGSRFEESVQIASIPEAEITCPDERWTGSTTGHIMETGWTRFHTRNMSRCFRFGNLYNSPKLAEGWLSQANHVFTRLNITSRLEDYGVVNGLDFWVEIPEPQAAERSPLGYLFICPTTDLRSGPSSYCWPVCPAYWSLDATGMERLSTEEATRLGFPAIEFKTWVEVYSWDASVYAGLRRFHQGKGFDPVSQDLARHLGLPLFEVANEMEVSFAHADEHTAFGVGQDSPNPGYARHGSAEMHKSPRNNNAFGFGDEFSGESDGVCPLLASDEEDDAVSWTSKLIRTIQLGLILFVWLSAAVRYV